jgi:hypothetical protein
VNKEKLELKETKHPIPHYDYYIDVALARGMVDRDAWKALLGSTKIGVWAAIWGPGGQANARQTLVSQAASEILKRKVDVSPNHVHKENPWMLLPLNSKAEAKKLTDVEAVVNTPHK